jgi:hypothetical protein
MYNSNIKKFLSLLKENTIILEKNKKFANLYIKNVFDIIFKNLNNNTKIIFSICSLFNQDFNKRIINKLKLKMSVIEINKNIDVLIMLSLINIIPEDGKLIIHPLLRKYGQEKFYDLKLNYILINLAEYYFKYLPIDDSILNEEKDNIVSITNEEFLINKEPSLIISIVKKFENYYLRNGLWEKRILILKNALTASDIINKLNLKGYFYHEIGKNILYTNSYKISLDYFVDSYNCYIESGNKLKPLEVLLDKGIVYQNLNEWDKSKSIILNIIMKLTDNKSIGAQLLKMECYINLANTAIKLETNKIMYKYIGLCEEILETLDGNSLNKNQICKISEINHKIGNLYFYKDNKNIKAKDKYEKSIELLNGIKSQTIREKSLYGWYFDHLSQWYFLNQKLFEAENYSKKSILIFKDIGKKDGYAYALDHLGECALALGYYWLSKAKKCKSNKVSIKLYLYNSEKYLKKANSNFEKSVQIFKYLMKKDAIAWLLHHLGESLENLSNLEKLRDKNKSISYANEAIKQFKSSLKLFINLKEEKEILHIKKHIADMKVNLLSENHYDILFLEYQKAIDNYYDRDLYKKIYSYCKENIFIEENYIFLESD